jgi:acyl-coenzyme A synthetase/AMP-(fatty) acid ligase
MTIALPDANRIGLFFKNQENGFWTSLWCLQSACMSASLNVSHMKNSVVRSLFNVILTDMDIDAPGVRTLSESEIAEIRSVVEQSSFFINENSSRIVLTSGTTGTPKAAVISGYTLVKRINNLRDNLDINSATCLWSLMGVDTIGGFTFPVATLIAGGTVNWLGYDDAKFAKFKAGFSRINLVLAAPNRIAAVLKAKNSIWPTKETRVLVTAGSQLHLKIRDQALSQFCHKVISLYGSTEAGTVAYADALMLDKHPELAGKVVSTHVVEVVNEQKQSLETGQIGEIRIKSDLLAEGYLEGGRLIPFSDRSYYPGDLGAVNRQGYLFITGRCDDVINIGGIKFNAADVERKIKMIDCITDCCLFVHSKDGIQKIALLVETDENNVVVLKSKISEEAGFKKNFSLVKVDVIPRNHMGKIPRKALSLWFEEKLKDSPAKETH